MFDDYMSYVICFLPPAVCFCFTHLFSVFLTYYSDASFTNLFIYITTAMLFQLVDFTLCTIVCLFVCLFISLFVCSFSCLFFCIFVNL